MELETGSRGWLRKARLIERAQELLEQGRLCMERRCLGEARHAARLGRAQHELGLCGRHAAELRRSGRRAEIRRLGPGEILDGPAQERGS